MTNYRIKVNLIFYNKRRAYAMKIVKRMLYITILLISFSNISYSLSTAVKSRNDYNFVLNKLRRLDIIIENFGTEQTRQNYSQIKSLFQEAGEELYGLNYVSSYDKFRKLKSDLIILSQALADEYMKRSKEILDSTSKTSFNIMIKYSKQGSLAKYFTRAFDPLEDIKPYNETDYHLFYHREYIENYISEGYKNYHRAKSLYNDPEVFVIKNRKNLPSESLNFLIDRYFEVIDTCRDAKMYGIEIYKLLNSSKLAEAIIKYNLKADRVDPVFDTRIPDEYKIDANDNLGLIHAIEEKKLVKYK